MYGVPEDLELPAFHGRHLDSVDLLEYVAYFRFGGSPSLEIGVEGRWEIRIGGEALSVNGYPLPTAEAASPFFPVGDVVVGSKLDAPFSFTLLFREGAVLQIFDSSDQFESFSIPQLGVYV